MFDRGADCNGVKSQERLRMEIRRRRPGADDASVRLAMGQNGRSCADVQFDRKIVGVFKARQAPRQPVDRERRRRRNAQRP